MRKGFTLIEIVVVLGVLGIIMVSVFTVLNGSLKTNNRVKWSTKVEQIGAFVLGELKRNILNSNNKIVCDSGKTFVNFQNAFDGQTTQIGCTNSAVGVLGGISSSSANLNLTLSGNDIATFGCDNFVTCDTLPSSEVSAVSFSFTLGAGISGSQNSENYATRKFQTKVTIRN